MKHLFILLCTVLLLSSTSCSIRFGGSYPTPKPHPRPCPQPTQAENNTSDCTITAEQLDARLNACMSISSFTKRDQALSRVSMDAAAINDIKRTTHALAKISSFTARDKAAENSALVFLNRHQYDEANQIAKLISSFTTRDRLLAKIAEGPSH